MPPTRTSTPLDDVDVIVLSSDDEGAPAVVTVKKTHKQMSKAKARSPYPLGEVLEISSEDEEPASTDQAALVANLQKQLKKLQKDNLTLRKEVASHRRAAERAQEELKREHKENEELKVSAAGKPASGQVDVSKLDDQISCEICTMKMWHPFILPECGHTFCESCLQDWFSTKLAEHVAVHPHFNVNTPDPIIPPHLRNHLPYYQQQVHGMALLAQYQPQLRPQYTCPTCREPVKSRPVEDFVLKGLVHVLAAAGGERSPSARKEKVTRSGKGKGVAKTNGRWDRFFPNRTI